MKRTLAAALLCLLVAPTTVHADDSWWSWAKRWLRSANEHVEEGNRQLEKGSHESALEAYDKAARQLPSEGGVHLNRGLALLETGEPAKAREALLNATRPPAAREVRADAYYNLGSSFYAEGDASAASDDHESAQKSFREAADVLRQALRLRPGDRDAAWNLELAMRRLSEEKEKQEQQEQQDQEQDDEQQEQDDQEQQQDDQEQNQDDQEQNQDDQKQNQDDRQEQQDQSKPKGEEDKKEPDKPQPSPQPDKDQSEPQQPDEPQQGRPEPLPDDARRALDALQNGEENLERVRARQRAARERRRPRKDW